MSKKPTYEELVQRVRELEKADPVCKQPEEAFRHHKELLQLFVKHTPAAVAMCDLQMRYLSYSDRWAQDYGLGVGNFVGRCHYDLFPDLPTHWKKEHQRCFDGEVIEKDEEPFPRKDGSMDWVQRKLCPWRHRSNEIGGLIMFTEVITKKKRLEDQLRQSQKIEAIGTLAGGIAHDFNNLLMGIQGRASLISIDLEPSHPHAKHIKAIEDCIRSGTHLTKQLLGFARGGKYEVRPIDINELLFESATMFGRTKKEIHTHTKLRDQPPVVAADRRQIEQVLLNLYINAWQAMPDGGELYLETKIVTLGDAYCKPYQVKPGDYAKVSVTDTSIGMWDRVGAGFSIWNHQKPRRHHHSKQPSWSGNKIQHLFADNRQKGISRGSHRNRACQGIGNHPSG